jgi:hypothetical protein
LPFARTACLSKGLISLTPDGGFAQRDVVMNWMARANAIQNPAGAW